MMDEEIKKDSKKKESEIKKESEMERRRMRWKETSHTKAHLEPR